MADGDLPTIMLACPRYSHDMNADLAHRVYLGASDHRHVVRIYSVGGSLLCRGFNTAWAAALTAAEKGEVDYFSMIHSDIVPEKFWCDKLVDELHASGADVLSAVVPLKGMHGYTSTAIGKPDFRWQPLTRLTMREVDKLPETFGAEDIGYPECPLLVNTGCWIADLRKEFWREADENGFFKYFFTINDQVYRSRTGKITVATEPEDWFFSRLLHENGKVVKATKKIALHHHGDIGLTNQGAWGSEETDTLSAAIWENADA